MQALAANSSGPEGSSSAALVPADERFPDEMARLREFYGCESTAEGGVLLTRSAESGLHRLFWVSSAAADLAVLPGVYAVVGAGTAVFEHTRARGSACEFRLCSDASSLWAADAAAARTAWLGPAAWAALLHGPGSGTDSAMPLTLLEDAAAAASEAEVTRLREMGAGCVLLRLEDQALRPECCVVGWLGAGTSDQQTVMLFCAANDLALLRELYLPRSLPFE